MVVMGRIRVPHGIKGWVKVQPFTHETEGLLDYPEWWVGRDGEWKPRRVAEMAVHGMTVIARLEGCDDREGAAAFKGSDIAIPRSELPETGENEFYWRDLLGAEVSNLRGEKLGKVASLLDTGANQVLVLEGDRERLIPFISSVIIEVDVAGKRLVVEWETDY